MMFLAGFISGLVFGVILFLVAYAILREVIFKYGKPLGRMIEKALVEFEDKTKDTTQIVYPNMVREMFEKEGSTLEDNII